MSSGGALAKRYARAILELAVEAGQVEQVGSELRDLANAWSSSDELREVFTNPGFSYSARKAVLQELLTRSGVSQLTRNSVLYLADKNRVIALADIARSYTLLAEQAAGTVHAEVTSAAPLSDAYYAQLQRALEQVTGQKVSIEKRTDPSLIAGVVTRVGDKVLDGSIRSRLADLRESLKSS
jgi:F-type H+-transporting ATPase subunit delta